MEIGLADIYRHYRHKDDLAEAWFGRADLALVCATQREGWHSLSTRARLSLAILAWLEALAPRRRLTAEAALQAAAGAPASAGARPAAYQPHRAMDPGGRLPAGQPACAGRRKRSC